ncbi:hypothetical protein A3I45_00375 [Candidatus Uhrbacteria bacterium RIFCSPLOWO2_02_FULL_53_10]|uniref:Glycosyl transferase family 1 domain-containing protein n=1 Tax=Candidatus Uhrbacteria bacterium RIFCSPLOWO2_02_FULL_53_10 TaxID=1802411 RepID=A0A1F7VI74_9BACT|nr:MAG: hypothetical protein A3I45_00375 [Candidatus Uhrbacteria bacterium RIFCSPLOWO2_02_FULL_53_10]
MTIAIDVRSLCDAHPSGVGHALYEILRAWPTTDDTMVLFSCGRKPPRLPRSITERPNVRSIHRTIPNKIVNALIALRLVSLEQLLGSRVDAVWFPNTGFLPRTRARTIITAHDLAFHLMKSTYTWKDHARYAITRTIASLRRANAVIAISESTARDVLQLHPNGRVHTVLHGVDHEQFHQNPLPSDATWLQRYGIKKPYLLFVATIEPRKNVPSLIEAFDTVAKTHRSLQLVISGGRGWKRTSFERALKSTEHRDRILTIGYVEDSARPALMRHALALCLPSRYEGFGMQVLEAMACGAPVICSSNSSLPEVGGDAPLYVRAMNVRELERALEHILSSNTLRYHCRERGLAQSQSFNWNHTANGVLKVITKTAAS